MCRSVLHTLPHLDYNLCVADNCNSGEGMLRGVDGAFLLLQDEET